MLTCTVVCGQFPSKVDCCLWCLLFVATYLCQGYFTFFEIHITLTSVAQECRGVVSLQGVALWKVLIHGSTHDTISAQLQKCYTLLVWEVKCSNIVMSLPNVLNIRMYQHAHVWHHLALLPGLLSHVLPFHILPVSPSILFHILKASVISHVNRMPLFAIVMFSCFMVLCRIYISVRTDISAWSTPFIDCSYST